MTITATAEPLFQPPRNVVEIEIPVVGAIMQSVSVWRNLDGARTDLRAQPVAGFEARTVYDYECPYEVEVTYGWTTEYIDPDAVTEEWTEPWADLDDWNTTIGSWSVSAGKLVSTAANPAPEITRELDEDKYRIVFDAVPENIGRIDFGGFYIDLLNSRLVSGSSSITYSPGTTTWNIDVTDTSVVLTTSAGSYSVTADVMVSGITITGLIPSATNALDFGALGTGDGQFSGSAITYIGVDPLSGNVYVVDGGNSRIQKFTSSGVFVLKWGSAGSGDGQFSSPRAVAFDTSGNVYVADHGNSRIQKFDSSGNYVSKWAITGNGPKDLAIDSSNNVFVVSGSNIRKYSTAGALLATFGNVAGTGNGEYSGAGTLYSVAVDASGDVYVGDGNSNPRIQKFSNAGSFILAWGSGGTSDGQFTLGNPSGTPLMLAVGPSGHVYVLDIPAKRIQRFTNTGTFVSKWGYLASNGQLTNPTDLTIDASENVYVMQAYTGTEVQKFTQTGTASVDDITLSSYGVTTSLTEESDPVTLSPAEGWFIHPASPGLSFPVAFEDWDELYALVASIGEIGNADTSTQHNILGSEFPIITATGPRLGDSLSMQLSLATLAQDAAIRALLRDQTPLLIQFPPSWEYGFDAGFYAVRNPRRTRELQIPADERRTVTLELQSVVSPIVTQQNVGWSYAELALLASYTYAKAAFATYADMATNVRNPGY